MQTASAADLSSPEPSDEDLNYKLLLDTLRHRIGGPDPLFRTDATGLWEVFLAALPASRRQHYTCRTCQSFIERFGGLVRITDSGATLSVLWDPKLAQDLFFDAIFQLRTHVQQANVTGVFYSAEKTLGTPSTKAKKPPGGWHHLAADLPDAVLFTEAVRMPHQAEAARAVELDVLERAMGNSPWRSFSKPMRCWPTTSSRRPKRPWAVRSGP